MSASNGAEAAAEEQTYVEFKVFSRHADNRQYHVGRFPRIPTEPATAAKPQPDFKEFVEPVIMRLQEIERSQDDDVVDTIDQDALAEDQRRKRSGRRVQRRKREFEWMMEDASEPEKKKYIGKDAGNAEARYIVLVPPQVDGEDTRCFRAMPLKKWLNFNKPRVGARAAKTAEAAETAMNQKRNKEDERMRSMLKNVPTDHTDRDKAKEKQLNKLLGEDDRTGGDGDGSRSGGGGHGKAKQQSWKIKREGISILDEEPPTPPPDDEEEDVSALAIDRIQAKGGDESFADFDDTFEDDEDDGQDMAEADIKNNSSSLEQSAETYKETTDDLMMDEQPDDGLENASDNEEEHNNTNDPFEMTNIGDVNDDDDDDDDLDETSNTLALRNRMAANMFMKKKGTSAAARASAAATAAAAAAASGETAQLPSAAGAAGSTSDGAAGTGAGGTTDGSGQTQALPNTNGNATGTAAAAGSASSSSSPIHRRPHVPAGVQALTQQQAHRKTTQAAAAARAGVIAGNGVINFAALKAAIVQVIRETPGHITGKALVKHLRKLGVYGTGNDFGALLKRALGEVSDMKKDVVNGTHFVLKPAYL